jgi:hypothetical protein
MLHMFFVENRGQLRAVSEVVFYPSLPISLEVVTALPQQCMC